MPDALWLSQIYLAECVNFWKRNGIHFCAISLTMQQAMVTFVNTLVFSHRQIIFPILWSLNNWQIKIKLHSNSISIYLIYKTSIILKISWLAKLSKCVITFTLLRYFSHFKLQWRFSTNQVMCRGQLSFCLYLLSFISVA